MRTITVQVYECEGDLPTNLIEFVELLAKLLKATPDEFRETLTIDIYPTWEDEQVGLRVEYERPETLLEKVSRETIEKVNRNRLMQAAKEERRIAYEELKKEFGE